ncbi:MAG TPA: ArsR family transcriptional regulator [Streptosporangiaceae bacterium]
MTADLTSLMLQAQPMRLRIDAQLRHGPASSSTLARVLGESIEFTNLHLLQMTERGFIEEVPELSDGQERWWRSASAELRLPPRKEQTAEMRALIDEINRINFAADVDDLMRSQLEQDESESWESQFHYSRGAIHVTPGELVEFLQEYSKLLSRYERREGDARAGVRAVLTRIVAFPAPAPPVAEATRPAHGAKEDA